jgi:hypothetical protein
VESVAAHLSNVYLLFNDYPADQNEVTPHCCTSCALATCRLITSVNASVMLLRAAHDTVAGVNRPVHGRI